MIILFHTELIMIFKKHILQMGLIFCLGGCSLIVVGLFYDFIYLSIFGISLYGISLIISLCILFESGEILNNLKSENKFLLKEIKKLQELKDKLEVNKD